MPSTLPTAVLVHGAWHTPPNYQNYVDALKSQGFKVICPTLPSCSNKSPPDGSLTEDVNHVRGIVTQIVKAGERVLMVMHSYGGIVGTDAIEDLAFADRKAAGMVGGVVHLLYMCAYMLEPGSSVWEIVKEAGVTHLWPQYVKNFTDGSTFPINPVQHFLGGVDQETVDKALPHLVRSPMAVFETQTKGSSWKIVPTTYIFTQLDAAVPRIFQDMMVEKVKKAGIVIKTDDYETCHSIFITKQDEMVQAVVKAAEDERNPK
jgi:pimeloyl-ACP methyl ester carboxylesterase